MNILFIDWPCFGRDDVLDFFITNHHHVTNFSHPDLDLRKSPIFLSEINQVIETQAFDFCFSYNYFPLVAQACYSHGLKYISLVYDSPQVKLYSYTVTYPTNYIFVFDSIIVEQFRKEGINTFYYMPLPVNADKIDHLLAQEANTTQFQSEVSFVGSLYNEEHNLYDRLPSLSPYTKGYLEGLLLAQSKVYGYNFLEDSLPPSILEEIQSAIQYQKNPDGVETLSYIFSDYFLCRKLTSMERMEYLNLISQYFPLKIYTHNPNTIIGKAQNMGSADYTTEMPYIFHNSKINLNITLRSIKNGIPLRCMDIMKSGGFLLTNYQFDLLRHFTPNEDFVYFDSKEDLINKIDYYLSHEDERISIAKSGYEKVRKNHNYTCTFQQIFEIVFSK